MFSLLSIYTFVCWTALSEDGKSNHRRGPDGVEKVESDLIPSVKFAILTIYEHYEVGHLSAPSYCQKTDPTTPPFVASTPINRNPNLTRHKFALSRSMRLAKDHYLFSSSQCGIIPRF